MMKKTLTLIAAAILFCCVPDTSGQDNMSANAVIGSWMGKINAGAIDLRVVFNLSVIGADSLVATLDSPDQGAKNIRLGPVTLKDGTIKISAGALMAEYNGTFMNDTTIDGTWKQAGRSTGLKLGKLKEKFEVRRPQEPSAPYPYTSEDIAIRNDKAGITLAGTLTVPDGSGPFPGVVLISGSGPQNRNEELLGHKPFLVLADHLARNGIAVLRYDDRGVGKSEGNYAAATSADLATDAEAAFLRLKDDKRIKSGFIGFAGHSEGGLIAPLAVSAGTPAAFIVSLAGPGLRGDLIIERQAADIGRLSGTEESKIRESATVNRKLFEILRKEKDNKAASEKMLAWYKEYLATYDADEAEKKESLATGSASLAPESLTWMRYFVSTDPALFWKKVSCPVLALNGEKDLQVAADENLEAIGKALKKGGNKNFTAVKLKDLNHLFQHSKTGLPKEYGEIEETFSPEALKLISDWIRGL